MLIIIIIIIIIIIVIIIDWENSVWYLFTLGSECAVWRAQNLPWTVST